MASSPSTPTSSSTPVIVASSVVPDEEAVKKLKIFKTIDNLKRLCKKDETEQTTKNVVEQTEPTRNMFLILNGLMVFITCITYAAFWSNASRLYTEPAIIANIEHYGCTPDNKDKVESTIFDLIYRITVGAMAFDFLRAYVSILIIPTSFLWYSYYIEDSESTKYVTGGKAKVGVFIMYVCLWVAGVCAICSLVAFGYSMESYNYCGSTELQTKAVCAWCLLAASIISFGLWMTCVICSSLMIENAVQNSTLFVGSKAFCNFIKYYGWAPCIACSKKKQKRYFE